MLASLPLTRTAAGANDRINLAFIGTGRMGLANMAFAARVPGFEIISVCDANQAALDKAVAQARNLGFKGVNAVREFRDVLADPSVDAVSIAAPDLWHAYMTTEACKAGKDVWIETPACTQVEDGAKMIAAARKYQRIVQAGTTQRSGSLFRTARRIVTSGALGDVTFCSAFDAILPNAETAGATPDLGLHPLDLVQFAFDEVMPLSATTQGGMQNSIHVTYRYPGFIASYQSGTCLSNPDRGDTAGTVFCGTKATLMVNRRGYSVFPNGSWVQPLMEGSAASSDVNISHWKNFEECIRSRREPAGEIETCVRSTITCLLAKHSLRQNRTVEWDAQSFAVRPFEAHLCRSGWHRAPWEMEA